MEFQMILLASWDFNGVSWDFNGIMWDFAGI